MNKESYLKKFKVGGKPNEDHYIADQCFNYFGKKLAFPRIMSLIKLHGRQFVFQTLQEVQHSNPKNPVALFLWKMKQNKVQWSDKAA